MSRLSTRSSSAILLATLTLLVVPHLESDGFGSLLRVRQDAHAGRRAPITSAGPAAPREPAADRPAPVHAAVLTGLRTAERVPVVIALDDGVAHDAPLSELARATSAAQEAVLAALPPGSFTPSWRYAYMPALAGRITAEGLAVARRLEQVAMVEHDTLHEALGAAARPLQIAEAAQVVRADIVRQRYGLTGEGVTVAVLDTGIDNGHPDFDGKILAQHCWASFTRSCPPADTVQSESGQDEQGHGTAVSGIILSRGQVSAPGMAPGADLVTARVFRDRGGASTSDIIAGLDWVMRQQLELSIRVVNMSLGAGGSIGNNCDGQQPSTKRAFQRLASRGVSIFVATGNNGFTDRVSSPACISNSIAVGATYDGEFDDGGRYCPDQTNVTPLTIACFTNRGRAMDLLAPGLFISAPQVGGGVTSPGAGTSYAAPVAAGVAALLYEIDPDLRQSEVERILQDTGRTVVHPESGDEIPLVDALAAVESILPATATPEATATPTPAPPTATPTVTPPPTATAAPDAGPIYLPALANGP